LNIADDSRAES